MAWEMFLHMGSEAHFGLSFHFAHCSRSDVFPPSSSQTGRAQTRNAATHQQRCCDHARSACCPHLWIVCFPDSASETDSPLQVVAVDEYMYGWD
jgi:hypothetical protein